ncbi:MAG: hypothetical protein NT073_27640, partial [Spirosoma sp.]|nr:hypothetical protein [Spirosoma sp.]
MLILINLTGIGHLAHAQSGSQGNAFIPTGAETTVFGAHSFQSGGSGTLPGIILTDRSPVPGYFSFAPGASWTGAADNAHVNGYVRTYGTSAFTFPIGSGTAYRALSIPAPASSTAYDAAYFSTNPSAATLPTGAPFPTGNLGTGVTGVSPVEYWDLNGTAATTVTLTWNAASDLNTLAGGIASRLIVVGYNTSTSKWENLGQASITGTLGGVGTITSSTSFIPDTYSALTFGTLATPDLIMSFGQPTPALTAGVTSTLPVSVSNIGLGSTIGLVTVTVTIPANVTVPASFTTGDFGCVVASATVSCTSTTPITAGSSTTLAVPLTPSAAAVGSTVTFNGIVANPNDSNPANNAAAPLTVGPVLAAPAPDLVTTIGQPFPALTAGVTSTLPISVSNIGSAVTTGPITVTVSVPANFTVPASFTTGNFGCVVASATVTCTSNTPITAGSSTTLAVPLTPTAAAVGSTPTINGGSNTPGDSNPTNNQAPPITVGPVLAAPAPDLVVTIGQPFPALTAGVTSTLPISVSNIGNATSTGPITVTVSVPANFTVPASFTTGNFGCVVASATVTCTSNTPITAGSSTTLAVPLTPTAAAVGSTPTINGGVNTPGDSNPTNNQASPITVGPVTAAPAPDLIIRIGQPFPALVAGVTSTLPISVSNIGNATSTGPITVTVSVPANFTVPASFTTGDFGCVVASATVTCTSNTPITAGSSTTLAVPLTPSAAAVGSTVTFTGEVNTPGDSNPANNLAPLLTAGPVLAAPAPDLVITIGQPFPALTAGVTSTLPISVSNIGTATSTGPITVTVSVPANFTVPASFTTGNFGCVVASATVTCTSNTPITAGSSTTLAVPLTPTPGAVGSTPTINGGVNTPGDSNPANNQAPPVTVGPVLVAPAPDLVVRIGQPFPALTAGVTSTLPISVSNIGNATSTGPITVTVSVPANFTVPASFTTGDFGCVVASATVTCTSNTPITAGSSTTLAVPLTPTAAATGNTPTINGGVNTPGDSNPANNQAPPVTAGPVLAAPAPDLVVTIGQPFPALTAGLTSTLPISVSNIGSAVTTGPITVTVSVPANFTVPASFTTGDFGCLVASATVTCTSNTPITAGSSTTLAVPLTPTAAATGNTPTINGGVNTPGDGNPANNQAPPVTVGPVAPVPAPDLVIRIGQPFPALVAGVTSTLPISVSNIGNATSTGPITVTVSVPANFTVPASFTTGDFGCVVASATVTCTSNTPITAGSSTTLAVPLTPTAAAIGSTPTITGGVNTPGDSNPANNQSPSVTVGPVTAAPAPDLVITIGQPFPALTAGVTSTLPISVSNIGSAVTTGPITVTVSVPANFTVPASFTTGNFGCVVASATVTCTSNTPITAGSSTTLAVPLTPTAAAIGSTPTITGGVNTPGDGNPANNQATPVTAGPVLAAPAPDLVITIGQPFPALTAGVTSTLPISVSNIGNATSTGPITVTVSVPANFTVPASFTTGDFGCVVASATVTCTSNTPITAGSSTTLAVPLTPTVPAIGSTPTITGGVNTPGDSNPANNQAPPITAGPVLATPAPDLVVTIGQPFPALTAGVTSTLPISVSNIGTAVTTGPITVTVSVPANFTVPASFTTGDFGCVVASATVTCTSNTPITAGSSTTLAVPLTPTAAAIGSTPTINGGVNTPGDSNPANNQAPPITAGPVRAAPAPDLVIVIGQPMPSLVAGMTSTLPISVSNIGNATTTGPITVTVSVPANFTVPASFTTGYFGCVVASGTVTCTSPTLLMAVNSTTLAIPLTPTAAAIGSTPTINGRVDTPGDSNPANNQAPPVTVGPVSAVPAPDLVITIGQPFPALTAGVTSTLPISVSNIGTAVTTGPITVTVSVPANFTVPASFTTGNFGCVVASATVTCTSNTPITAGSSTTLAVPLTPTAAAIGSTPTINGGVNTPGDSNPANNQAPPVTAGPVKAAPAPDLIITIGQPFPALTVGVTSTLPISVSNIGTAVTTGPITVTVSVPANFTVPASFTTGN